MITTDCMRTVRFAPYRKGAGPTFTLKLYDINSSIGRIGYRLLKHYRKHTSIVFEGTDFRPSPLHSIDGNECVKSLMGFLTLRFGDTDAEYFRDYNEMQLQFSQEHAETLACNVYDRFGE